MSKTSMFRIAVLLAAGIPATGVARAGILPPEQEEINEPGYYYMTTDRRVSIHIASSDVELDCGGRGIYAGPPPIDAPVHECGKGEHGILIMTPGYWTNNVTIRNCVIHGWEAGIYGQFVDGVLIDQTLAAHNWDGFDINWGANVEIRNSKALHNGGQCGNEANGDGIDFDLVANSMIWRNTVDGNLDHGVTLNQPEKNPDGSRKKCTEVPWRNVNVTFTRNGVTRNGRNGFNVKATKDSAFRNNKVDKNTGRGFEFDACNENNVACGNWGCNGRDGCLSQPACP